MKTSWMIGAGLAAVLAGCAGTGNNTPAGSSMTSAPAASSTVPGASRYGHPGETIYDFPPGGYEARKQQQQAAPTPSKTTASAPVSLPPPPVQPPAAASGPKTYIVQPGDSLWGIAHKHGVKVEQLHTANSLAGDVIKPGQKLIIP